mmetsp:Transcript_12301/g.26867  ORF Transcript_12301/g.26867 Transcript_12301/m.26867 type:complete len:787 (-) Transcript_12301:721-3081(-)
MPTMQRLPNLPPSEIGMASGNSSNTSVVDKTITRVDGKGLWRSWKRNFKNKLLAVLDLVDNSLDASIQAQQAGEQSNFIGRCHIYPDVYDELGLGVSSETTTGIVIVNNCTGPIRSLKHALEVYDSSKVASGAGQVGENGVGLKQACATMSDLSFVLTKNESTCELGIIAESLQRVEGCYLPAFTFSSVNQIGIEGQLRSLCRVSDHRDVAECIAMYGAAKSGGLPDLSVGINRLTNHFNKICNFHGNDYVFAVVLDKIRHGHSNAAVEPTVDGEQKACVESLLRDMKEQMPKIYLHVPESFDFRIKNSNLEFKHWSKRLVEFTSFTVRVGKKVEWQQTVGKHDVIDGSVYDLRVFVGFDGWRITDRDAKKEATLHIYSRQSGRLISTVPDARTLLSLTAGGTQFCQALTILIDDYKGMLPLNPTKQEVAFGVEATGEIHKENLFKSVGSIVTYFYHYNLKKYGKKKMLTEAISEFGSAIVQDEISHSHNHLKSLDTATLTTFTNFNFKKYGSDSLRVDSTKNPPQIRLGVDTRYRLQPRVAAEAGRKRKANKGAVDEPVPRRARSSANYEAEDVSSNAGIPSAAAPYRHSSSRSRSVPVRSASWGVAAVTRLLDDDHDDSDGESEPPPARAAASSRSSVLSSSSRPVADLLFDSDEEVLDLEQEGNTTNSGNGEDEEDDIKPAAALSSASGSAAKLAYTGKSGDDNTTTNTKSTNPYHGMFPSDDSVDDEVLGVDHYRELCSNLTKKLVERKRNHRRELAEKDERIRQLEQRVSQLEGKEKNGYL